MNANDVWITIVLLALATIATRGAFFLLANTVKLPPRIQHALRYAPAAAMAAIVAPDLLSFGGVPDVSWRNPKLWAGIGAVLFFLSTRHMLATIVVGMAIFAAMRTML